MDYKIDKYPDNTSYVTYFNHYNSTHVGEFRINSYEDLWHLHQLVDAANARGIRPRIMLPNLLDAQADRRFQDNQSSGLKLVCKFLNQMNADFHVFHPHNAEVVESLIDGVVIADNSEFIHRVLNSLLVEKFGENYDSFQKQSLFSNLILMSSDAGGFKPLMKLCDKINWKGETFSASKSRSWDEEDGTKFVQQIDRFDFGGKDILIIDDISVYGGTFKGLANLLDSKGVGNLYLAVSHMTIQNFKGKDTVFEYYDKIFTTNSKFDNYFIEDKKGEAYQPQNLEIIKLFK